MNFEKGENFVQPNAPGKSGDVEGDLCVGGGGDAEGY